MKKTAFITGATSGIGKATALLFASKNIRLIICGRRKELLIKLQKQLEPLTDVYALNFDVSDKNAVSNAIKSLPEEFSHIDILSLVSG